MGVQQQCINKVTLAQHITLLAQYDHNITRSLVFFEVSEHAQMLRRAQVLARMHQVEQASAAVFLAGAVRNVGAVGADGQGEGVSE